MKSGLLSDCFHLKLVILLSSYLNIIAVNPVWANQEFVKEDRQEATPGYQIPQLDEIELPAASAQLLVQQPAPTNPPTNPPSQGGKQGSVAITGVKANPTEKGVEVILETNQGDKLQVANRSTGNNFIADITGGQLRLANGDAFTFKSEKPLEGITEITVTNIDANTVRVTVVGRKRYLWLSYLMMIKWAWFLPLQRQRRQPRNRKNRLKNSQQKRNRRRNHKRSRMTQLSWW